VHGDLLGDVDPRARALLGEPPPDRSAQVPGELDVEHRQLTADRVHHEVEGVGQRRAAQHARVVRPEGGDGDDLRPPHRIALEVDEHVPHGGWGRRQPPAVTEGEHATIMLGGPML